MNGSISPTGLGTQGHGAASRVQGVLVIDKPAGITSHDVIDRVRREWKLSKAGHLGTLDPAATGVLPVTIGKATRLAQFIPSDPKEYTGTIRLGWETSTDDAEGEPVGQSRPVSSTHTKIAAAMASFEGTIQQRPPAYSAKKIAGTTAYKLARKGKPVELPAVPVEIHEFTLQAAEAGCISFRVVCSAGTYVRSLARDLGRELNTGAHLETLRRIRSGPFDLGQAVAIEGARPIDVIPPEQLLRHLPETRVDDEGARHVAHGRPIPCAADGSRVRIFNKKGELIAIATAENGWARPRVVLI